MIITGTIKKIFDTQKITDSFSKRRLVVDVTENTKYPQPVTFIAFDRHKMKLCEELSGYKEGDSVEINFNLRGKESAHHPGKYLNDLEIWKIELINKEVNK